MILKGDVGSSTVIKKKIAPGKVSLSFFTTLAAVLAAATMPADQWQV
jgi:hypothetical protein